MRALRFCSGDTTSAPVLPVCSFVRAQTRVSHLGCAAGRAAAAGRPALPSALTGSETPVEGPVVASREFPRGKGLLMALATMAHSEKLAGFVSRER